VLSRAGLNGAPASQLAGALRCHWNNRKYGAGTVGNITRQRISPKIVSSIFIARLQKCSPALFQTEKKFEEYRSKAAPDY